MVEIRLGCYSMNCRPIDMIEEVELSRFTQDLDLVEKKLS